MLGPSRIVLVQSDASSLDSDGFGYFTSGFTSEEMKPSERWYAQGWDAHFEFGNKSHEREFMPPSLIYERSRRLGYSCVMGSRPSGGIWTLDKGTCKDAETFEVSREEWQVADHSGSRESKTILSTFLLKTILQRSYASRGMVLEGE